MKKNTKIISFLFIFLISTFFFFKEKYIIGLFFILLSFIPIFFIFRNEFLILSLFKIIRKDFNGLEKYLKCIKDPESQLTKEQISYYYFLNGILYSNKNLLKSEYYMKKSLDLGLRLNENIAIAKLNIAIAHLSRGDKKNAKNFLLEAKKMDASGMLREHIQFIYIKMKKMNENCMMNPFIKRSL
ncbi:tetratricopeptide repeat protein [Blattabacterium cuenoti]|uniref:tetratricopeptide repeat protein n=1 Tax=Blattabacterium cuenoti TaxID=1653831 RepID=UPI00163BB6CA|nr:hypothetical protein [Blattabacterium cuenoti]